MARSSNEQREYLTQTYPKVWDGFQAARGAIRELARWTSRRKS